MEFATTDQTVKDYINQYDNLIVNRTFSKAFAIAGARLGYILANKELIQTLYTIKTPYSVNNLSQQIGVMSLQNLSYLQDNIKMIYIEKQWLLKKLESLQIKTYPSETNFLYVYFDQFDLGNALKKKQVLIRSFKNNYYRITVSNRIENEILIRKLEEILNENC
jgi:histidinol-phosphate aminotransferase